MGANRVVYVPDSALGDWNAMDELVRKNPSRYKSVSAVIVKAVHAFLHAETGVGDAKELTGRLGAPTLDTIVLEVDVDGAVEQVGVRGAWLVAPYEARHPDTSRWGVALTAKGRFLLYTQPATGPRTAELFDRMADLYRDARRTGGVPYIVAHNADKALKTREVRWLEDYAE